MPRGSRSRLQIGDRACHRRGTGRRRIKPVHDPHRQAAHTPPNREQAAPSPAVAVAAATALAACGGSNPPSGSAGSQASGAGPVAQAYRHSACMRSHGVPNFPDPQVHDGGRTISIEVNPSITGAPAHQDRPAGMRPLPPRRRRERPERERSAGAHRRDARLCSLPADPWLRELPQDPTAQGDLNLSMITAAGINLHQPALLRAGFACVGVTHGDITRADVERAVNGPPGQTTQSSSSGSTQSSAGG